MPQDEKENLVQLNRLPVDHEQIGRLALKLHEMQRRVFEGTQPVEDLYSIVDRFNNLPKPDPQIHAARKAAWKLERDARLLPLTHIALITKEHKDISDALTCAELLQTKQAYACMLRLYYQLGAGVEHAPMKRFLLEDPETKTICGRLEHNFIWRKVFGHTALNFSDADSWLAECEEILQLGRHQIFDQVIFELIAISKVIKGSNHEDTVTRLLATLSGDYAKAAALIMLERTDDVRRQLQSDLERGTDDFHPETSAEQALNMLLIASRIFWKSGNPGDYYFICKLLRNINQLERTNIVSDPAFNNLAAIETFHRDFWQNIAEGFEPDNSLGKIVRRFFEKCDRSNPINGILLFHPTHWLFPFLGKHFGFIDELASSEGRQEQYDPESYNLTRPQKISAYLRFAHWRGGGDRYARNALERAYNHALELEDSFYKVLLLCDIYQMKDKYGLTR